MFVFYLGRTMRISIHALHEESDGLLDVAGTKEEISIHALHEESDTTYFSQSQGIYHFNPRSP